MRLIEYLSYSCSNEKTNTFRAMNIKLVRKKSNYEGVITEVCQEHKVIEKDIMDLKKKLNENLRKTYTGQCLFDFCLDDGTPLQKIKVPRRIYNKLMTFLLEANELLEKAQKDIANNIPI